MINAGNHPQSLAAKQFIQENEYYLLQQSEVSK